MKFVALVYLEDEKLRAVPDSECMACGKGFQEAGRLVAAEALQPIKTAKTLRVRQGAVRVVDGLMGLASTSPRRSRRASSSTFASGRPRL